MKNFFFFISNSTIWNSKDDKDVLFYITKESSEFKNITTNVIKVVNDYIEKYPDFKNVFFKYLNNYHEVGNELKFEKDMCFLLNKFSDDKISDYDIKEFLVYKHFRNDLLNGLYNNLLSEDNPFDKDNIHTLYFISQENLTSTERFERICQISGSFLKKFPEFINVLERYQSTIPFVDGLKFEKDICFLLNKFSSDKIVHYDIEEYLEIRYIISNFFSFMSDLLKDDDFLPIMERYYKTIDWEYLIDTKDDMVILYAKYKMDNKIDYDIKEYLESDFVKKILESDEIINKLEYNPDFYKELCESFNSEFFNCNYISPKLEFFNCNYTSSNLEFFNCNYISSDLNFF